MAAAPRRFLSGALAGRGAGWRRPGGCSSRSRIEPNADRVCQVVSITIKKGRAHLIFKAQRPMTTIRLRQANVTLALVRGVVDDHEPPIARRVVQSHAMKQSDVQLPFQARVHSSSRQSPRRSRSASGTTSRRTPRSATSGRRRRTSTPPSGSATTTALSTPSIPTGSASRRFRRYTPAPSVCRRRTPPYARNLNACVRRSSSWGGSRPGSN